jgi:hypothetical protein
LEKQINAEYDALTTLLQDNAYVIAEQEETFVVSLVTKEDPVAPIGVLLNNVRNKQLNAIKDTDRLQSDVTMLKGHTQRYAMLDNKKKQLLGTEGGVQKIKKVVRARKDHVNIDTLNEDSQPAVILKWLGAQLKQYSAYDEKPENITKTSKCWFILVYTLFILTYSSRLFRPLPLYYRKRNWFVHAVHENSPMSMTSIPFKIVW